MTTQNIFLTPFVENIRRTLIKCSAQKVKLYLRKHLRLCSHLTFFLHKKLTMVLFLVKQSNSRQCSKIQFVHEGSLEGQASFE